MAPGDWDESARAHDSPPPGIRHGDRGGGDEKGPAPGSRNSRDKIRCLDGLRGIACLIVFNYHFFWPWTSLIMLGYGAFPPRTAEPYWNLPSLPIICLLHRGRPMVAIFFAISGYVLCRHILRSIHERRLDEAYQKLASAVFRRVFRLYIPPTISMFLVAMLAQIGAFRSNESIYTGPDSIYINGTVTVAKNLTALGKFNNLEKSCFNATPVVGAAGIADYMGLQSPMYLRNITNSTDLFCVNQTNRLYGPSSLYILVDEYKASLPKNLNTTNSTTTATVTKATGLLTGADKLGSKISLDKGKGKRDKVAPAPKKGKQVKQVKQKQQLDKKPLLKDQHGVNATKPLNLTWVQFGGSWEEHPFIHDNITYALQNFTRAYAEWANPFNFGHYHPRYDPHTFTIPMELRGSMFIYLFLLGTAAIQARWRLRIGGFLSAYSLIFGRWDMAAFMGGTLLSEMDIRRGTEPGQVSSGNRTLVPPVTEARGRHIGQRSPKRERATRWLVLFGGLYFLSYPDAGAEYTPGFVFLSSLVPKYYIPLSGWMFYQSMGALMLLPCIIRSPTLTRILEGPTAQYLGKVSFSLYLVHGPVLHSLGFWIMPRLFDLFGRTVGYIVGYPILLSITLYLTSLWHKKVDVWSVTVGKRVERALTVE